MDPATIGMGISALGSLSGGSGAGAGPDVLKAGDISTAGPTFNNQGFMNFGEILRPYNEGPVNLGGHPINYSRYTAVPAKAFPSLNNLVQKNSASTWLILGGLGVLGFLAYRGIN